MDNEKRDDATTGTETTPKRKFGGPQAGAGRPPRGYDSPLGRWVAASGMSKEDVAKALGLSVSALYFLLREESIPTLQTALKLHRLTNGEVSVFYWEKFL